MDDATYIHERADGRLVEYRRDGAETGRLKIEGRVLRPDGRPYDEQWDEISDRELLRLQRCTDIIDLLDPR